MDLLGPLTSSLNFLPLKQHHHAKALAGKLIEGVCDIPAKLLKEQVMIADLVQTLSKFDWETWNKVYKIAAKLQNPAEAASVTQKDKEWLHELFADFGDMDDEDIIDHIPNFESMVQLLRDLAVDLGFHINECRYPKVDQYDWFVEIYEIIIKFVESESP